MKSEHIYEGLAVPMDHTGAKNFKAHSSTSERRLIRANHPAGQAAIAF